MKYFILVITSLLVLTSAGTAPEETTPQTEILTFVTHDEAENHWVDSTFNALSLDDRIGQLFSIRAHSDKGAEHIKSVKEIIRKYHVGGLCFFQGTPKKQVELLNEYQQLSPIPLMVAIDGEWGLGMRMKKTTISFPRQLMLGAIRDNDLIYDFGAMVAKQLKRVGVTVNFAPVVDINNNPGNPVINDRSFGEDRYNVAVKGYMYMMGMQDNNIMACAKHFPGHGDTDVDSHKDLPVIMHDMRRLDSIELFPFKILARQGVGSMMVAHLDVPAIDNRPNRPTSLSKNAVTGLLRNKLMYDGLLFTDGLGMKGVTKHFRPGQADAEALAAGNDVLLLPQDIPAAIKEIKGYLKEGLISEDQFNTSVKRILRAKYRLGLTKYTPIDSKDINKQLNSKEALALKQKLIENAITLVRNKDNFIPIKKPNQLSIASLSIGTKHKTAFQKRLDSYATVSHYQVKKDISVSKQKELLSTLSKKDLVIVSLHDMNKYSKKNFGLTQSELDFIHELNTKTKVILVVFGSPYSLKYFDYIDWVLESYQEDDMIGDVSAQALFGGIAILGRLPVTASAKSVFNQGVEVGAPIRLGYCVPEEVGIRSDSLFKIDSIARLGILKKAYPGCVVLAAKDGKIFYKKAFGYHTFSKRNREDDNDIFDLASITKVAASTIAVMKMEEEGLIDIEDSLGVYLPSLKGTNKSGLVIRDVMTHTSGLRSWIPFYKETVAGRRHPHPSKEFYRTSWSPEFSIPVTNKLFLRTDFRDTIWRRIVESDLRARRDYKYSDLGFYFIALLTQKVTGYSIDEYVTQEFYQPLSLRTMGYNPTKKFPMSRIVPTEKDNYWRRQVIQGYVHDMGAAMLGGVSGHAGLFSDVEDLAAIMQMLLWQGRYAGTALLNPTTISDFTARPKGLTRRGIGFDMKETDMTARRNLSPKASLSTFGHLGFTGTATWADPETGILFVFLSNRTYPSMRNYKLNKLNIRPAIQTVLYDALIDGEKG